MENNLKDLTFEQINDLVQKNAEELSKTKGKKVLPLLINDAGFDSKEGNWVIGYFYAPSLRQKMSMMDSLEKDKFFKGFQLLKQNLITENSDVRFLQEENDACHGIIMGASIEVANKSIDIALNQAVELKKNG